MHEFRYAGRKLYCEKVSIESLAKKFGTPLYVYSQQTLRQHYRRLDRALTPLNHLICFAVKANSNLAVLRTLSDLGAGFDIVSEGELKRVMAAGGDPGKCAFAGVGKTESEIAFALRCGIHTINAESEAELKRINEVASRQNLIAPVAVRVNPNVDAHTHAKITTGTYQNKFGIALEEIERVYRRASKLKNLWLRGVQMHIGSQLMEARPFVEAVRKVSPIVARLAARYSLEFFSIGGGLGIVYKNALASGAEKWWRSSAAQKIITPEKYAAKVVPLLRTLGLQILLEPGRFIAGNAGILVTRVEYVKRTGKKNFVIVDAAMNDLIRPAFYDSYHEIVPVVKSNSGLVSSDVVGPICESGDFFCKDRPVPKVRQGDYLSLLSAGAYGFVMASNYNARPLAAEVMVNGRKATLVRERQSIEKLWAGERVMGREKDSD